MVGTLSPRASAGAERKEPWPLTGFSVSRWTAAFIEMPGYRSQMRCPAEPGLVKKISKPGLSPLGKPTEPTCLSIETAHTHTSQTTAANALTELVCDASADNPKLSQL